MRSKIYANEIVPNRDRRFGSATVYYPALLVRSDGSEVPVLLTSNELDEAIDRAKANGEDIEAAIVADRRTRRRTLRAVAAVLVVAVPLAVAGFYALQLAGQVIAWAG